MKPISRTTTLIYKKGRKRKVEKHIKRIYYPDHNTGELKPIITKPEDAKIYYNHYRLEIVKHDLFIGFSPKYNDLPFVRFTEPKTGATFAMWIKGFGKNIKETGIRPKNIEKHRFGAFYEMDNNVDIKFDVLGHMIRKKIIIKNRPDWNSITIRIVRANGYLILGKKVGKNRLFYAFNKKDSLPIFSIIEPHAWDSANKGTMHPPNTIRLTTIVKNISLGVWDIIININPEDLDNAIYPIIVDPQIILQPDGSEGKEAHLRGCGVAPSQKNWNIGQCTKGAGWIGVWDNTQSKGRRILKFDLSDIPNGATITEAIQTHRRAEYYQDGFTEIYIYRLLRDWGEGVHCDQDATNGECSWNHYSYPDMWTTEGADSPGNDRVSDYDDYTDGLTPNGDPLEVYVTNAVQAIVNGAINYGWRMSTAETATNFATTDYYSDDATDASKRTKLTITYTVPSVNIKIPITKWFNKVRPFKWI